MKIKDKIRSNKLRKVCKDVNRIKSGFKPISQCYRDEVGVLKASKDDIIKIWHDYFSELLYDE